VDGLGDEAHLSKVGTRESVGAMIVSFTNSKPATSTNQEGPPLPENKGLGLGNRAPMGSPGAF